MHGGCALDPAAASGTPRACTEACVFTAWDHGYCVRSGQGGSAQLFFVYESGDIETLNLSNIDHNQIQFAAPREPPQAPPVPGSNP